MKKICKHKHYGEFNMFNGDDVTVWTCLDCMQSIDKPQKEKFNQYRISIVCSDKTYMIEEND